MPGNGESDFLEWLVEQMRIYLDAKSQTRVIAIACNLVPEMIYVKRCDNEFVEGI